MTDNDDPFKANLSKKPKKKKLTVPSDFLDNAKSYDDKLILVKLLAEKEKGRVMLLLKKMLEPEKPKKPKP